MYYAIALLVFAVLVAGLILMLRLGATVKAEVYSAVSKGEYQFIALMDKDGTIIYPQVEGIPDWYLKVTGFAIQQTDDATREADLRHMKEYNVTMYSILQDEGKLGEIEREIEVVRENLKIDEAHPEAGSGL